MDLYYSHESHSHSHCEEEYISAGTADYSSTVHTSQYQQQQQQHHHQLLLQHNYQFLLQQQLQRDSIEKEDLWIDQLLLLENVLASCPHRSAMVPMSDSAAATVDGAIDAGGGVGHVGKLRMKRTSKRHRIRSDSYIQHTSQQQQQESVKMMMMAITGDEDPGLKATADNRDLPSPLLLPDYNDQPISLPSTPSQLQHQQHQQQLYSGIASGPFEHSSVLPYPVTTATAVVSTTNSATSDSVAAPDTWITTTTTSNDDCNNSTLSGVSVIQRRGEALPSRRITQTNDSDAGCAASAAAAAAVSTVVVNIVDADHSDSELLLPELVDSTRFEDAELCVISSDPVGVAAAINTNTSLAKPININYIHLQETQEQQQQEQPQQNVPVPFKPYRSVVRERSNTIESQYSNCCCSVNSNHTSTVLHSSPATTTLPIQLLSSTAAMAEDKDTIAMDEASSIKIGDVGALQSIELADVCRIRTDSQSIATPLRSSPSMSTRMRTSPVRWAPPQFNPPIAFSSYHHPQQQQQQHGEWCHSNGNSWNDYEKSGECDNYSENGNSNDNSMQLF